MLVTLRSSLMTLGVVSALAGNVPRAQAAAIEAYGAGTEQDVVLLLGKITDGDAVSLKRIVEATAQGGRKPVVSLNSPGGLFLEGIRLAETVNRFGLTTYVEEGAHCASACFLVFVAGKEKFVSYNARIGVHSSKDDKGDVARAAAATKAMGLLLKSLQVSQPIIQKMITTPHEKIAWLSTPELESIGVKPLGFAATSPIELALPAISDRSPDPALPDADKSWLWSRLVRAASRLSAKQNGGRASIVNSCNSQACTSSVSYANGSDPPRTLRTTRDRSGKITSREVCQGTEAAGNQHCRLWARAP